MKKIICIFVVLCKLISICYAKTYTDMPPENHWSHDALNYAINNEILHGYDDGSIRPNDWLTRAQTAAIIVRTFNSDASNEFTGYVDVNPKSWYYDDVKATAIKGFFMGSDGMFFPDKEISRQEVFMVIYRAIGLKPSFQQSQFIDYNDISPWAVEAVNALCFNGYIHGSEDNFLHPLNKITRAEFCQILYNLFEKTSNASINSKDINTTNSVKMGNSTTGQGGNNTIPSDEKKEEADDNYKNGDTYLDDIF